MLSLLMLGLASFLAVGLSYLSGPGWLPHNTCPYCCWCTGRRPRGEVYEDRLRAWLFGGDGSDA